MRFNKFNKKFNKFKNNCKIKNKKMTIYNKK